MRCIIRGREVTNRRKFYCALTVRSMQRVMPDGGNVMRVPTAKLIPASRSREPTHLRLFAWKFSFNSMPFCYGILSWREFKLTLHSMRTICVVRWNATGEGGRTLKGVKWQLVAPRHMHFNALISTRNFANRLYLNSNFFLNLAVSAQWLRGPWRHRISWKCLDVKGALSCAPACPWCTNPARTLAEEGGGLSNSWEEEDWWLCQNFKPWLDNSRGPEYRIKYVHLSLIF